MGQYRIDAVGLTNPCVSWVASAWFLAKYFRARYASSWSNESKYFPFQRSSLCARSRCVDLFTSLWVYAKYAIVCTPKWFPSFWSTHHGRVCHRYGASFVCTMIWSQSYQRQSSCTQLIARCVIDRLWCFHFVQ